MSAAVIMEEPISLPVKKKRGGAIPGAGRKPLPITEQQVFELAKDYCTVEEISAVLGCSRDVIYARFYNALEDGRHVGNSFVRRKMMYRALNGFKGEGDTSMLIWLSKQYLGHTDKRQDEVVSLNFNVTVNEVPQ